MWHTPDVWAQRHYTITDLGQVSATSINNQGQITITEYDYSTGTARGGIYYKGHVQYIDGVSSAASINDHGQVTGYFFTSSGDAHAYLHSAAHLRDLGPGYGEQVNNLGTVTAGVGTFPNDSAALSFNGSPLQGLLNVPEPSRLAGINDLNVVIAETGQYPRVYREFVWWYGQVLYLPSIDGLGGQIAVAAINNRGHICGEAESGGYGANHWHAYLYANGKFTSLIGKGIYTAAFGMNSHDQIVGYDGPMRDGDNHAALFVKGQVFDLNDLIPTNISTTHGAFPGWMLEEAIGINDGGQIIGSGRYYLPNGSRQNRAFLLTPL
jgi:probable HAF family extracellular repeat protein